MQDQSRPQKYYFGINASYHDASIAMVNENGEIVFAQATERDLQAKRSLYMAADSYSFTHKLLEEYAVSDYEIAFNWQEYKSIFMRVTSALIAWDLQKASSLFYHVVRLVSGVDDDRLINLHNFNFINNVSIRGRVGFNLRFLLNYKNRLKYKTIQQFDHHLCHAYHAYYTSPKNNHAIILIIDGSGDYGKATSIYEANNGTINLTFRNAPGSSLGTFYGSLTKLCGFEIFTGEEWKVMGMAPYGKKHEELYADLKDWMYVDGISLKTKNKRQFFHIEKKLLNNSYKDLKREDIAYNTQLVYEEIVIELVNEMYKKWPSENLILAGGCALNSACNGMLHKHTPYKNIYIPSAPADDGGAVGAALLAFQKSNPGKVIPANQKDPYLGFEIKDADLENVVKYSGYRSEKLEYPELYKTVASHLLNGKIIAWAQGRAEFGPRALGNRSILANPTLSDMKDNINSKVKFREEFRPFAPAILEEHARDFFEDYHPTPYMERVLKIKEEQRSILKAVNHVDNTGRLQTVSKEMNEHFYNLISEFNKVSNVPVLLNTSLNVMGKPIADSVNDLVNIFSTSGIDILVVNQYVFYKS